MNFVLIFLILATVMVSNKGFNDGYFFNKYQFNIGRIKAGEVIRMITSGFLHADWSHLIFNMLTLYFFAPIIINSFGSNIFLFIYLLCLLTGSLLTYKIYEKRPSYSAIGASGAVTGILYASILLFPDMTIGVMFILPMPAYLFGILYLFYSVYGMQRINDNIGHAAHIGGAIGGMLAIAFLQPQAFVAQPLVTILMSFPLFWIFLQIKKNKF